MAGDKGHDAVLEALEIAVGLGGGDDGAADPDGVDGHGGGGHGKAPSRRHRQGHTDGMAPPQDDGDRGLRHPRDELRDGKARLHVSAHGVEKKEDPRHLIALLQLGKKGQHVLIFRGFGAGGGGRVPLDLADDGEAVDIAVGSFGHGGAQV